MSDLTNQLHSKEELRKLVDQWAAVQDRLDDEVIYGYYDNSKASVFVRLNDYMIDRGRISLKEKAYFFYLLSVLSDAGVPLVKSLKLLARRTNNQRFRRIVNTMAFLVERGMRFSSALERFPDVFDEAAIGVVRSGEAVGHLDQMLLRLARQLEATYALNMRLKSALIYPSLVVLTLLVTGTIVMTYVIPQLASFFAQSGAQLPLMTKIMIFFSEALRSYWWLFGVSILLLFIMLGLYLKTDVGRLKWDYYKLRIPGAGGLIRKVLVAKFVRMLGVLIQAGIPVTKTMEITARSMTNELYRRKIFSVRDDVQSGKRISESLADAPFLFPEIVVHMLYMGENSASLDEMCQKISEHYDLEVDHAVKNFMSVLEPVTIILVAIAVAFVAFAIMGPIFALTDLV